MIHPRRAAMSVCCCYCTPHIRPSRFSVVLERHIVCVREPVAEPPIFRMRTGMESPATIRVSQVKSPCLDREKSG